MTESCLQLDCFGGSAELRAVPHGAAVDDLLAICAARLHEIHAALTRFDPRSELCRLNTDPRVAVPASALLRRLARAVPYAGRLSGGLVDATCLPDLERAGYRESFEQEVPVPQPAKAGPAATGAWALVADDRRARSVRRPPGVRIDSGGLAKGLAADLLAPALDSLPAYLIDCAGDLRLGGTGGQERTVEVRDPWGGAPVHSLSLRGGAVATSGVTRRAWPGGHHLIDPRTGAPADSGVAQVTALAPTALEAEVRAKAALLAGPRDAEKWLVHGGVVVADDGAVSIQGAG